MVKIKKGSVKKEVKKTVKKVTTKASFKSQMEQLMEYNIVLQKKNIELIGTINKLTNKIDKMVRIFEEAAQHIKAGVDEPLMTKLENLLEQNKNIAKGLLMLENYVKDKSIVKSQAGEELNKLDRRF